jgi:branched-chain amino acid aminotransferase
MDPKIHHCNLIQSILAKIEANHAGADDALMLDQRGFIAETNATHVFIVAEGHGRDAPTVETPRLVACPEGITRQTVLELCDGLGLPKSERDLSLTECYRASEVFCTGTMGELAWVSRVDGRVIGDGRMGATTRQLREAFREMTQQEGEVVVSP